MGRYTVRRLLQFIPVLLGTLFLLHYLQTLSFQINGNPVRALFGDRQPPPETIEAITRAYGLDDPCLEQTGNPCIQMFFIRLQNLLTGDFGQDFNGQEVIDIISRALPVTIQLTILAVIFETVVGILAGVIAGLRKDKLADNAVRISTTLVISVPIFVLGVLVQIFLGVLFGNWLKTREVPDALKAVFSPVYQADYEWASLILPAMVLGALSLGFIARLTRTSLIETLRADYVRTAKAKGLKPSRVVGVHALRNSLIPVVTYIGIDIGALMGGAIITEGIFNVPGIGGEVFRAIRQGETAVILAIVTLLVLVFLVTSLLVDLLYAVLDPRIRYE
jgi:peptide/nickel transport system permease protein/oligopeptide transport system permease protein